MVASLLNMRRGVLAAIVPLLIFTIFLLADGVSPLSVFSQMIQAAFGDGYGFGEVIVKTTPILLTALATALPARAGLVNVGGEGQLAIGALTATMFGVFVIDGFPSWIGLPLLALAGAAGGLMWAGIAAVLRSYGSINETISTLLLNYVALYTVGFFVHGILKDPASFNWPFSPPLSNSLRLPVLNGTRIHIGIIIAAIAAVLVWWMLSRTKLGFRLKAAGGNPIAAKLAGLKVTKLQIGILLAAGALAGIAGMIEVAGIEGRLRPATGATYGYLGFLAAWMAWNRPLWCIATSFLIGALTVAGNALEITSGLPSSAMNILMALVLFGILAAGRRKSA
jgi:general nucleoside transport system permease protein